MKHQPRTLRIIGGNWRSRKVSFTDQASLRPTGDRIRETLFNWLMHQLSGMICLDLYAGSGILSMEALSRGARHAVMVDQDKAVTSTILDNLHRLGAEDDSYEVITSTAEHWLESCSLSFDLVFLDPPFSDETLYDTCEQLAARHIARQFVYLETGSRLIEERLPAGWELYRQKTAGSVYYGLVRC